MYKTAKDIYNLNNNIAIPPKKTQPQKTQPQNQKRINLRWEQNTYNNTSDPHIWGPAMWFTFHLGSIKYPQHPSKHVRDGMKGYTKGIPYILPCQECSEHASEYIYCDKVKDCLDDIVSSRDKLFKFFVDFHNEVNKRTGKKIISYNDAYNMYNNGINIYKLSYK